jgi:hypothetical protein
MSERAAIPDLRVASAPEAVIAERPLLVSSTAEERVPASQWWRIADYGVIGIWAAIVGFALSHHEKWMDEAQAWLFARDLSLHDLWFHELRYEGSPGLWHTMLWVAQRVFHVGYGVIGPIGAACGLAGIALLILKAPFPRYIRWPLAFTYFLIYQYAVIARQYTLWPVLAFAAAYKFKDREHPEYITLVLVLLANVSFHGTVMAACFGLAYLVEVVPAWRSLPARLRMRYWICMGVMALTFVAVYAVVRPAADSREVAKKQGVLALPGWVNDQGEEITHTVKFESAISGAFLDYFAPSMIFLSLLLVWSAMRGRLLAFALPVAAQAALYAIVYGSPHHQGSLFVAAIAGLWIAWPTAQERAAASAFQMRALQCVTALLICVCAANVWDAAVVIERDYLYPYSGADDAVRYLKAVDAERGKIFAYGFAVSGIQAHFDHNIFANIPTAYTHNAVDSRTFILDKSELLRVNPEYVVTDSRNPRLAWQYDVPLLASLGYEFVHFSDGYYLYKRAVYERESYFIFRRRGTGFGASE